MRRPGGAARRHPRRRHRARRWAWRGLFLLAGCVTLIWGGSLRWRGGLTFHRGSAPNTIQADGSWFHAYTHLLLVDGSLLVFPQSVTTFQRLATGMGPTARTLAWSSYDFFINNRRTRWGYILGPANMGQRVTIPLLPVALGMTIGGWAIYRRDRRLSRIGHCLACGYDLRTLALESACPECGTWKRIVA